MTCVHKVKWSVKRPEDCRFRLSVSHYKDRIVAPDEYSGVTVVTPSDSEQVLATKGKTVRANITVNPAPTESLATSENGTFLPSSGNVGFSEVVVDVEPSLESLSVTENGLYLPESGTDGFDRVSVDVPPTIPDLRTLTASSNGLYQPDGFDGYNSVEVSVPQPSGGIEITQNGVYDVTDYVSVDVDVPIPAPVLDSLSVTQNGTYTPESGVDGFDEVVVNVPTGGGGGLTLLDTIEVNGVNGVQTDIDMSWFDTYDYVVMVPNLTFSRNDWPYIVNDATTGGGYATAMPSMGVQQSLFLGMAGSKLWGEWFRDSQLRPQPYEPTSYFYWYLYSASNTMTGTIKIYGIKITA